MSRLNTTTYDRRGQAMLEKLAEITLAIESPTILDVGAGGIILGSRSLISRGSPVRLLSKPLESLLRRIPFLPLQTFEPFNIQDAFVGRNPSITVVDIEPRVVEAVLRQSKGKIHAKTHDIGDGPVEPCVDIVICRATIHDSTSQDVPAMIHNLVLSVRVGGFILFGSTYRHEILKENVEKVDRAIYKRTQ